MGELDQLELAHSASYTSKPTSFACRDRQWMRAAIRDCFMQLVCDLDTHHPGPHECRVANEDGDWFVVNWEHRPGARAEPWADFPAHSNAGPGLSD